MELVLLVPESREASLRAKCRDVKSRKTHSGSAKARRLNKRVLSVAEIFATSKIHLKRQSRATALETN